MRRSKGISAFVVQSAAGCSEHRMLSRTITIFESLFLSGSATGFRIPLRTSCYLYIAVHKFFAAFSSKLLFSSGLLPKRYSQSNYLFQYERKMQAYHCFDTLHYKDS